MKILKATGQIDSGRKTSSLNRGMWSVLGFAGLMMMLVFNVIPVAVTQSGPALKNNAAAVWDAFNYGASGADGGYWAALTQEQLNASSGGRSMDYILADDNLTGGRNAAAAQEWEGYRASQNPRAGAGGIDAQSAEDTGVYNPSFKAAAHTAQQEAAAQAARARQAQRNGLTSSAAAGGKGGGGSSGGSSFSDG
ncbi:MAG: hypothetical protein LBR90_01260, partial [Elusimicrobiota bacterium]|nr:hypothetical protein [Elusimicrobiota bacterium]